MTGAQASRLQMPRSRCRGHCKRGRLRSSLHLLLIAPRPKRERYLLKRRPKRAMNSKHSCLRFRIFGVAFVLVLLGSLVISLVTAQQPNDQLTGNWAVRTPNADGTFRTTYFNLKQEGSRITGTIRVTQFFYHITESTGGPDGFTITGSMMDGKSERKVLYEGKLVGDELHVSTRRRPTDKPTEMVAKRAPASEGALPARLPL